MDDRNLEAIALAGRESEANALDGKIYVVSLGREFKAKRLLH